MTVKPRILVCGHCGNRSPMESKGQAQHVTVYGTDPRYTDEDYRYWDLFVCPVCARPLLVETFCTTFEQDPIAGCWPSHTNVLYPSEAVDTDGLPDKVKVALLEALRLRQVSPNAFAVMLGRLLEIICEDKQAHGDNLVAQLGYLAGQGEIPQRLAEMAHKLRILRNFGAHAGPNDLGPQDVPILVDFTEVILEYIYRAPKKLEAMQRRIDQLKNRVPD